MCSQAVLIFFLFYCCFFCVLFHSKNGGRVHISFNSSLIPGTLSQCNNLFTMVLQIQHVQMSSTVCVPHFYCFCFTLDKKNVFKVLWDY